MEVTRVVRRGLTSLAVAVVVLGGLATTPPARAAWSAATTPGPAASASVTLTAPTGLTVARNNGVLSSTVTVSWNAVLVDGTPVPGYRVVLGGSGVTLPTTRGCTTTVTTTSCTDVFALNLLAQYTYEVRAVVNNWTGPPSTGSA